MNEGLTPLERQLHKQIADALRIEIGAPARLTRNGVMWWGVDHSNSASIAPGARIELGIVAGHPDLAFMYRAKMFFQEIKRPTGVLSEAQQFFMAAARLSGAECAICTDAQSCIANLDIWGIPRARKIIFPMTEGNTA